MTRRLATLLLSLTACADLPTEGDEQAATTPEVDLSQVKLPGDLESTVFAALGTTAQHARVMKSSIDQLGTTHVRVRQLVQNVPVWEGEAIVHVAPDGAAELTDARDQDLDLDVVPRVTADRAVELARAACTGCAPLATSDLWVLRDGSARLVWRVKLGGIQDGREVMPIVFVDAHDGTIARSWDNVQHATGQTQYNGTRTIPAFYYNSRYYLEDDVYNLGVYDLRSGTNPDEDPYSRIASVDSQFSRTDSAQAMFSVRNVAEYFWGTHEHWNPDGEGGPGKVNAIDLNGKRLSVFIDAQFVDQNYEIYGANASWADGRLKLGKGDAEWGDLTSLDIVGHEFTHGVIEYTAGLVYMNESGAINESFADVFGAMAERYRLGESANTWRIGEDAYTVAVSGDELRRMDDPTADGESQDHYSGLQTGTWDNGYVHTNSGIGNKAFHLVAIGGSHRLGGSMRGIGADRAARIWYHALSYLTSGSKYVNARAATLSSARDLFGYHSVEWNAVANAWALVGVGSVANDALVNGNFETESTWEYTGRAFTTSGFPQSGTRYLMFGGLVSQPGTATQEFSIDPLARSATLSFWVNVTGSDPASLPADRLTVDLIDADTGASLGRAGAWSNLDRTTVGNYTFRSYSLTALRGRTVRLKINSVNDSANATTFRVDNIVVASTR